ncbi:MAG: hypothetical protein NC548_36275 [Lachnospiraceae bacterium]|nr:hypothetical protein [Lachnospiraceae bacterium]MCM1373304.1 hypothetical protein [Bacteroides sp.]
MKNIVGIDFGHGETSAGLVISDSTQGNEINMSDLKIVGEEPVIPSIVCVMPGGEEIIFPSTYQIAKSNEVGISFKAPIVGSHKYPQISEKDRRYFRMFLTKAYESIKSNPSNNLHISQDGQSDFLVYIACPSGWDSEQINAYKEFANTECGIPVIDIVKESRAAYIATRRKVTGGDRTQGGNVLVIDFGSSTVDFTYFNNDNRFEPVHEGYPFGARMIEERFLEYLKDTETVAKERIALVEQICGSDKGRNVLLFAIRKLKEEYFKSPNQDEFLLSMDLRNLLLDKSLTNLYIEPSSVNGYTKQEVVDILSEYIKNLADMLDDFLTKDGVTTVDKVILTGGASRMFFFKDLVSQKYNVSKEEQTLIVDPNPSLTISQGISAFGFMNEKSGNNEKPLWKDVDNFIESSLPGILRSALNKAVADIYYNEFTRITERYRNGYISDSNNRHNLDALEDAFIDFLKSYSTSPESVGSKVASAVERSVSSAINTRLKAFTDNWNYEAGSINVAFDFDTTYYLPVETAKGVLEFMWAKLAEFINNRDFWGTTSDTPYKDRDSSDRSSIVSNLNSNLRSKCNALHYDGDLEDELSVIEAAIRSKIQDIVDNAKLEMYR